MTAILASLFTLLITQRAHAAGFSVQDYNKTLPVWGTSWKPGSDAVNGYYPSFYTGFAPRSQSPKRIHVRLARGNQTRVSVILDDETLRDYVFDLYKRYEFYRRVTTGSSPLARTQISGAALSPQLEQFNQIIESPIYEIATFAQEAFRTRLTDETIYLKGLSTLNSLNPGRVFAIHLNLQTEFRKWRSQIRTLLKDERDIASYFATHPADAIIAINSLVFGRVNISEQPSASLLAKLAATAELALSDGDENHFTIEAASLFSLATGDKYEFRTLGQNNQWRPALLCKTANDCTLTYSEFSAVYPTGSVQAQTRDQFGNSIANFATPGLWRFLSRGSRHDVDNIRDEPYYGWAPKMDYEEIGNGFHNPAVRFASVSGAVKNTLGIPASHSTFWSVMRGGVSHGCSRLPLGHVWEMRHIFPVENGKMTQIDYFGNDPRDFDVYDIDGDGEPEVIGVEYLISYGLSGSSDLGRREGADLDIGEGKKLSFYQNLYGSKKVFTVSTEGKYLFDRPTVSMPSYLDFQKKKIQARLTVNSTVPLYEQAYERDKIQFYVPFTTSGLTTPGSSPMSKRFVRLMGRVRGCAPNADKNKCGESAFDREAAEILKQAR